MEYQYIGHDGELACYAERPVCDTNMPLAEAAEATTIAFSADDAWQAELKAVFGKRACDARYDARGYSTPKLAMLRDAKYAADEAMQAAYRAASPFNTVFTDGSWTLVRKAA